MTEMKFPYEGDGYRIERHVGTITTYLTGWAKEINVVSWNGSTPKYDIRDWSPDHELMSKGIALFEDEFKVLVRIGIVDAFRDVPDVAHQTGGELNG